MSDDPPGDTAEVGVARGEAARQGASAPIDAPKTIGPAGADQGEVWGEGPSARSAFPETGWRWGVVVQVLRSRAGLIAAGVVLGVVLGAGWGGLVRQKAQARARPPVTCELDGDLLHVRDGTGAVLWQHRFPGEMGKGACLESALPSNPGTRGLLGDFDSDGEIEVIVRGGGASPAGQRFYGFRQDGAMEFAVTPGRDVSFGGQLYRSPFLPFGLVSLVGPGGRASAWAVTTHNIWFPSVLVELGPGGRFLSEYWSHGYIASVAANRRHVLVGATDNETRGASLAVFRVGAVKGAAPSAKPAYRCENCPPGEPEFYLTFPRLDTCRVVGHLSTIRGIRTPNEHQVMVEVEQGRSSETGSLPGLAIYTLDATTFAVTGIEFQPGFEVLHRLLQNRGRLDHAFGSRDRSAASEVRLWREGRYVPAQVSSTAGS
jgi:hypothetical protein